MAEKHEIVELGNANRDDKGVVFLADSSSGPRRGRFVASVKGRFGPSQKGVVLAPELWERSAASSSSVCSSTRIEGLMQSKTEFATAVDWEIEASKDHWSELEQPRSEESSSDAEDESVPLTNGEIVESLQRQYPRMSEFFLDGAGYVEVGEKIAEGAQADIFTAKLGTGFGHNGYVLKVFKEGSLIRNLQKQWPLALLNRCKEMRLVANSEYSSSIWSGTVVMNGRFAFLMGRCWGDLRKLLDKRLERTSNRCPPLTDYELKRNMWCIAKGMKSLHEDNIIHRDLKASNVLISFFSNQGDDFNGDVCPNYYGCEEADYEGSAANVFSEYYGCEVADYECSVGVVGTGFWRAPEILQGLKDRKIMGTPIAPHLFTKKSDVYSFAMTCYEMVTGKIPLEGLPLNDYDAVLQGERSILLEGTKPWIKELLSRCWHHDPSERPDFVDIVKVIKHYVGSRFI